MTKTKRTTKMHKSEQGFTLVELLLVIALVSISIGITADILVSLTRSYNKTAVTNEIEQQANFIGLKLEKELRNSSNVTLPNANCISFQINGVAIYYNVANNNIFRSTGSCSTAVGNALLATPAITGSLNGVSAACLGSCFTLTGTSPQVVDLSFVFSQSSGGTTSFRGEVQLKNTIVIRNSY